MKLKNWGKIEKREPSHMHYDVACVRSVWSRNNFLLLSCLRMYFLIASPLHSTKPGYLSEQSEFSHRIERRTDVLASKGTSSSILV